MGNYTETFPTQIVISNLGCGPTERRRRTVINTYPVELTFKMDRTQATALTTFFMGSANYGTTPFTWTHPRTGVDIKTQFLRPPELTADMYYTYTVKVSFQLTHQL